MHSICCEQVSQTWQPALRSTLCRAPGTWLHVWQCLVKVPLHIVDTLCCPTHVTTVSTALGDEPVCCAGGVAFCVAVLPQGPPDHCLAGTCF